MRLNCSILNLWNMDLNIDVEITFKTFGQNVFLKGVEIQALNQFGIQVLNQISLSVE